MATVGVLLADLVVIVVLARLLAALATRLGQPAVIGEIIAGIAAGADPARAAPRSLADAVPRRRPAVPDRPGRARRRACSCSSSACEWTTVCCAGRAASRPPCRSARSRCRSASARCWRSAPGRVHDRTDDRLAFVLFLGIAMSITAFPVLARILTDGACTAPRSACWPWPAPRSTTCSPGRCWRRGGGAGRGGDDPLAWCASLVLTAVVVAHVRRGPAAAGPAERRAVPAGRPAAAPASLVAVAAGVLVSACVTELIGIHAIFGAFLFGAVMPREGAAALRTRRSLPWLEQVSVLSAPAAVLRGRRPPRRPVRGGRRWRWRAGADPAGGHRRQVRRRATPAPGSMSVRAPAVRRARPS